MARSRASCHAESWNCAVSVDPKRRAASAPERHGVGGRPAEGRHRRGLDGRSVGYGRCAGVGNMATNRPPVSVSLIAPKASLIVRKDPSGPEPPDRASEAQGR